MVNNELNVAMQHSYRDVIRLFNQTFSESERTLLVKGEDEPIYIPAKTQFDKHQIVFAHGYFASALHEIAHWCIAGKERRLLEDYGYWYCPDGRNKHEQAAFEKVEIKPQAIEWGFSLAAGKTFRVSTDNLNGVPVNVDAFEQAVKQQLSVYLQQGFPPRAVLFIRELRQFYATPELNKVSLHATSR